MSLEEALNLLDDSEAFRATVYAMNTLLIEKGIYTSREFEALFCEHAENYKVRFAGKSKRNQKISSETAHANP